ncbi:hypothetical protein BV25DRAFT_1913118 [Artomyces pyxidatus]|uniref:Uncharacterized protein n=1 Tax=Artomyces pyxidatus TaxID=48021 RepID=A0ACB8TDD3_9AGAM|nr:hypothetical protein BV25DRAFT_1913118 [Artomyces pyxidatus]
MDRCVQTKPEVVPPAGLLLARSHRHRVIVPTSYHDVSYNSNDAHRCAQLSLPSGTDMISIPESCSITKRDPLLVRTRHVCKRHGWDAKAGPRLALQQAVSRAVISRFAGRQTRGGSFAHACLRSRTSARPPASDPGRSASDDVEEACAAEHREHITYMSAQIPIRQRVAQISSSAPSNSPDSSWAHHRRQATVQCLTPQILSAGTPVCKAPVSTDVVDPSAVAS